MTARSGLSVAQGAALSVGAVLGTGLNGLPALLSLVIAGGAPAYQALRAGRGGQRVPSGR